MEQPTEKLTANLKRQVILEHMAKARAARTKQGFSRPREVAQAAALAMWAKRGVKAKRRALVEKLKKKA